MAMPSIEEMNGKYAGKWILVRKPWEDPVRLYKVKEVKDRFACSFLIEAERSWRMNEKDGHIWFSSDSHSPETICFSDLDDGLAKVMDTEEALEVIRGFRETLAKVL